MLKNHSNETLCSSWTPEEIEELRNVLLTGEVAAVDTAIFGKRFSEIVIRAAKARDNRSRGNSSYSHQRNKSILINEPHQIQGS
jgi:hypothetical protein